MKKTSTVALAFALLALGSLSGCLVRDARPEDKIPPGYAPNHVPDVSSVLYRTAPNRYLDVHLPVTPASGVAIVYLHSGGWVAGDKSAARSAAIPEWLREHGHVIFSVDYTLSVNGSASFPANINDVKWAIAWANHPYTKAAYGYSKVVVMGESAGGQLAALATTTGEHRPPDMVAGWNPRPDGGMSFSGPIDMYTFGAQGSAQAQAVQQAFAPYFWGAGYARPDQVPELARIAATARFYVDPSDPPIYLASGTVDGLADPAYNANVLVQRYAAVGPGDDKAWNDIVEGDGHNLGDQNMVAADLFLKMVASGQL